MKPSIDVLEAQLTELYDKRALLITRLYDEGLRHIDLQRLLRMNGGSVTAALNRAAKLRTKLALATDDARDFTNEQTPSVSDRTDVRGKAEITTANPNTGNINLNMGNSNDDDDLEWSYSGGDDVG